MSFWQEKQVLPFSLPERHLDFNAGGTFADARHPSVHEKPKVNEFMSKSRDPAYGPEGQVVMTRYMRSRQEAAFNPITGRHLDDKVESALCKKETEEIVTRANRGQDRALAVGTQYDVVNFESKRQGLDPPDDGS